MNSRLFQSFNNTRFKRRHILLRDDIAARMAFCCMLYVADCWCCRDKATSLVAVADQARLTPEVSCNCRRSQGRSDLRGVVHGMAAASVPSLMSLALSLENDLDCGVREFGDQVRQAKKTIQSVNRGFFFSWGKCCRLAKSALQAYWPRVFSGVLVQIFLHHYFRLSCRSASVCCGYKGLSNETIKSEEASHAFGVLLDSMPYQFHGHFAVKRGCINLGTTRAYKHAPGKTKSIACFDWPKASEEGFIRIFTEIYGMARRASIEIEDKYASATCTFGTTGEILESFMGNSCVRAKYDEIVSLISYSTDYMFGRCSHDVDGLMPANQSDIAGNPLAEGTSKKMPRETPRLRDSPPCVESYFTYITIEHAETALSFGCDVRRTIKRSSLAVNESCKMPLLQSVAPQFPQVVLLEVTPLAEEASIGRGFFVVLVFQSGEFDAASEICNLEHPIFGWMCFPVHHRTLEEGILESCMKNAGNERLTVVVVNLDEVKLSELIEVIKQELCQITLHGANECTRRLVSVLPVREDVIAERSMLRERAEGHEELGALRCIEVPVLLVCPEKRVEVEGDVWEASVRERLLVQIDRAGEIVALVMKDQGEQIVLGFSSEVAGLIYKDGELLHETSPLDTDDMS